MKSITFYQVQSTLYKVTIPKVIIKILEVAKKVNFLCKDEDEMEYLDSLMWSFSQLSFIFSSIICFGWPNFFSLFFFFK